MDCWCELSSSPTSRHNQYFCNNIKLWEASHSIRATWVCSISSVTDPPTYGSPSSSCWLLLLLLLLFIQRQLCVTSFGCGRKPPPTFHKRCLDGHWMLNLVIQRKGGVEFIALQCRGILLIQHRVLTRFMLLLRYGELPQLWSWHNFLYRSGHVSSAQEVQMLEAWMNTKEDKYMVRHGTKMLQLASFTTFWCLKQQLPLSIDDLESWQVVLVDFSQQQACLRISRKHAHDCWWATIRDRQSNTPRNFVSGRQLYTHQVCFWCMTSCSASCRKFFTFYTTIVLLEHRYYHSSHSCELSTAWVVFQV